MKALTPFLIIGLCIGMYMMYITPLFADIARLVNTKSQYEGVMAKIEDINLKRAEIEAAYEAISPEDKTKLDKIIPREINPVKLVNDLNYISAKNLLITSDFAVNRDEKLNYHGEDITSSKTRTTSVGFKLVGTLDRFINFLRDIESSLTIMDIKSLTVTTIVGKNPLDIKYEYSIVLNTYSVQ